MPGPHLRTPKHITSLSNDRVKAIRALDMRKERKETGLFVAEGASILVTAREHGFKPVMLAYLAGREMSDGQRSLVDDAMRADAEILEVSQAVLEKIAAKDNPQSVIGVFRQHWAEAPAAQDLGGRDVWVALEEVRDPGNLGTIIRTVDAVGARGVILVGNTTDPYARECIRATMGSIFAVPIVRMERAAFLDWRSRWPGDVVGTHLEATEDFRVAAYRGPVLLVMGGEGPGLSDSLARSCSRLVKIPMAGRLDSLNLAVATALTLYEIRRAELKL